MRACIKFNFLLTILSSLGTTQLTLYWESPDICSEDRTEHIKCKMQTKCSVFIVTATCPCSYHWALHGDRLLQYISGGTIIDKFLVRNDSDGSVANLASSRYKPEIQSAWYSRQYSNPKPQVYSVTAK